MTGRLQSRKKQLTACCTIVKDKAKKHAAIRSREKLKKSNFGIKRICL